MPSDDDIDFEAYMRDRGVARGSGEQGERSGPPQGAGVEELRAEIAGLARALKGARILREQAREALATAEAERNEARRVLATMRAEHAEAREALARMQAERDAAREALARMQAERDAVAKERRALQRKVAAAPEPPPARPADPTLREVLAERGVSDEDEAVELLMGLLDRDSAALLDGVRATPMLSARGLDRLALCCERPECQPEGSQAVVLRVASERCDVCGGSDIKAAFDQLLRASRLAGVTRLVIVGGSPPYHTQLRELSRGTDLKLDLVSGRSKPGKRRARNDVERVVIWGATILDHGTSAAYDHLGDRLIRVSHRGISRMLREVAEAL